MAKIIGKNIIVSGFATSINVATGGTVDLNIVPSISPSSGIFVTTSNVATAVTGVSVTVTTTGRAVKIFVQPNQGATGSIFASYNAPSGAVTTTEAQLFIFRDGVNIFGFNFDGTVGNPTGSTQGVDIRNAASFSFVDHNATAGSHTYALFASVPVGPSGASLEIANCQLGVYEF